MVDCCVYWFRIGFRLGWNILLVRMLLLSMFKSFFSFISPLFHMGTSPWELPGEIPLHYCFVSVHCQEATMSVARVKFTVLLFCMSTSPWELPGEIPLHYCFECSHRQEAAM